MSISRRKLWHAALVVEVFGVYAFLYLPMLLIVFMSFHDGPVMKFPPEELSWRWYGTFLENDVVHRAIFNSVVLAGSAAVISGVLGTLCALGLARLRFRARPVVQGFVLIPMLLPRVILGTAVLSLLHRLEVPRGFTYLIVGHVVITLPYVILVVTSALYTFRRELEESALSLGANEVQTFVEVTFPLLLPSIISGVLFAFTMSFQELEATQAWTTSRTMTLPVNIFSQIREQLTPEVNVIGVLFIAIGVVLPTLAEWLLRRLRESAAA